MKPQSDQTQSEAQARAVGSSFYTAMQILPAVQRRAVFEIYSFCRAVDDIADDGGPREIRLEQLQEWRDDIDAVYAGAPPLHLRPLAEAIREYDLAREDFVAVIDGMEMDLISTIRAPDWARLDLYCDRVASAVGRLCVRVFGMEREPGLKLAHHLGRALQLTNILRDIDEDAEIGRLYLPREALREAGIGTTEPTEVLASPGIAEACAAVVARAEAHFDESDAIIAGCPRRPVRAPRIMAAVYRTILSGLVARGWGAPRARVKVPRSRLIWYVLRSALP
jgi:squalene synthase HpnD